MSGIVEVPALIGLGGQVMHGPNQVVPRVKVPEVGDVTLASGEPVAFQSRADQEVAPGMVFRLRNPIEIGGEVAHRHAPVIEGLGGVWSVVRNPVFRKLSLLGSRDKLGGRALGVVAKGSVGVIIGAHWGGRYPFYALAPDPSIHTRFAIVRRARQA